ncbi:hypothetical protein N8534_00910 [bacterium]|nr:hypothetical protein [bacterium]
MSTLTNSSPLLNSFDLNKEGSARETYHVELSLKDSGLEYQVGDALGVLSHNPAQVVDEMLPLLPFNVKDFVPLPSGAEVSLREALITSYDILKLLVKQAIHISGRVWNDRLKR